jgi:hypothetical protein
MPESKTEKVRDIARGAKHKTKKILHIDDTRHQFEEQNGEIKGKIEDNAGFNPQITLNAESSTLEQLKDQMPDNIHEVPHMIRHPRGAAKNKTAGVLATSEQPYISDEDDERLVDMHGKLKRAEGKSVADSGREERVQELKESLKDMEEEREQKKVAWTSSRYIHRARVLDMKPDTFPVRSPCRWGDGDGDLQGREWTQWVDQIKLLIRSLYERVDLNDGDEEESWDRDMLLEQVERLAMASSPWQKWLMQVLKLHTWRSPIRTGSWFIVWVFVWYYNRVFSFIYCAGIYSVVQTMLGYQNTGALQESLDRVRNGSETPQTLGELIGKHGSSDWMEPLMETVLPLVQPVVKNWADWMEVLMNFWKYEDTRATRSALLVLMSALVLATFASPDICVRMLTLGAIFGFFIHHPISCRHPKYLQVLVPYQWVFWDVPTHLESSFRYLRTHADEARPILSDRESDWSLEDVKVKPQCNAAKSSKIFTTECSWDSKSGTVIISVEGLRFIQKFPQKKLWQRTFHDLKEVKKGDGKTSVLKTTENYMELFFKDGTSRKLGDLKNKDVLFNVVIAFSGIQWQQVPL